ncbi:MAG: hypothetical protein ACYDB2_06160 [Acidimicrobiales bacterium]
MITLKSVAPKVFSSGQHGEESEMKSNGGVRTVLAVLTGALIGTGSLSIGVDTASAAHVAHDVAMLGCLSQRMVRPSSYTLGCGSRTYVMTKVHWTAWGRTAARGTGRYELNTCTPSCSNANNVSYRATLMANGVRSTPSGMVYESLTINYVKGGHHTSVTWALPPF